MQEQQGQNELQTRLNKMKAISYYEQLELKMIKKVFAQLKSNWETKIEKYRSYYKMILYLKSFKGFMEYGLLQKDEKKQENNQMNHQILRKEDGDCEKQFSSQIIGLRRFILKGRFRKFTTQISKTIREKQFRRKKAIQLYQKERQEQQEARKRQQESIIKAKTQQAFNRRNIVQEKESDFKYMTSMAGNSLRQYSPVALTARQITATRRKYVPIKVLPPKPTNIPQIHSNTDSNKQKSNKQSIIKQTESINIQQNKQIGKQQQYNINNQNPNLIQQQLKMDNTKQQQKNIQILHQKTAKIRQNTLAILSELKMIEIISLNQIIEDYSHIFKRQSFPNQKNYIKQSIKILQKIKLIE